MKLLRRGAISLAILLFAAPLLLGQDLSRYRNFSLGMSLADLSKQIEATPADIRVIHQRPSRIEELLWWPRLSGYPPRQETVREILFSFCDGKLYRIYVRYADSATEGMTTSDMARAIIARYGPPSPQYDGISLTPPAESSEDRVVERWENSQYSVNLLQPSYSSTFALVLIAKQLNAEAQAAITAASKLELEDAPQKALDQKKKDADSLEASRAKNVKAFHP